MRKWWGREVSHLLGFGVYKFTRIQELCQKVYLYGNAHIAGVAAFQQPNLAAGFVSSQSASLVQMMSLFVHVHPTMVLLGYTQGHAKRTKVEAQTVPRISSSCILNSVYLFLLLLSTTEEQFSTFVSDSQYVY